MSPIEMRLTQAASKAMQDWKAGVNENPYPPGAEHDEYSRTMDLMHMTEDLA